MGYLRVQGLLELQEGGRLRRVKDQDQRPALVRPAVFVCVFFFVGREFAGFRNGQTIEFVRFVR